MQQFLDLDRFPIGDTDGDTDNGARDRLIETCRRTLSATGLVNLDGFVRAPALADTVGDLAPLFERAAFTHRRRHNIYFDNHIPGLAADHPALRQVETANRTLCADQIPGSLLARIYQWPPLIDFLARIVGQERLYQMADPLARINVMAYGSGEALNWHFDRAEFTITLLLQAPEAGGELQYRSDLRSDEDANYDGVARLLRGQDESVQTHPLAPGTLNVFKGKHTAHRVTPVEGARPRMIAVFSYYDRPGVEFSAAERQGFYGRSEPLAAAP